MRDFLKSEEGKSLFLNWVVEGAVKYYRDRANNKPFFIPERVVKDTNDYLNQQDVLVEYVNEHLSFKDDPDRKDEKGNIIIP